MDEHLLEIIALGMPIQFDMYERNGCTYIVLGNYEEAIKAAIRMIDHLKANGYKIVCESHSTGMGTVQ